VPKLIADTNPVLETVAIRGLELNHGVVGCAVPEPVKAEVPPLMAVKVPVGAEGGIAGSRVMYIVSFIVGQEDEELALPITR
jgi:hypothetical protein